MDFLWFVLIAVAVLGVAIGITVLVDKFKIKDSSINTFQLIIELINKINKKYDWKYSGELDTICNYVLMAVNIAKANIDMSDKKKVREYVFMQAESICILNNIKVDEELRDLLGKIIDSAIE